MVRFQLQIPNPNPDASPNPPNFLKAHNDLYIFRVIPHTKSYSIFKVFDDEGALDFRSEYLLD